MKHLRFAPRHWGWLWVLATTSVQAQTFDFAEKGKLTVNSRVALGAAWRMEPRDSDLIGKLNLNPHLCDGDDCRDFSGDPEPNQRLVDAPGGLAAHNNDNGNLNYDQYDPVFATTRLTTDLTYKVGKLTARFRGQGIFDAINTDFEESHPNTLYQPAHSPRDQVIERQVGKRLDVLEGFVSYPFDVYGQKVQVSVGEQRLRWGEANTIQLNSIGEINPVDQNLLYFPGVELTDIFLPIGAVTLSTQLPHDLTIELLYQYRWEALHPAAAGSFLSSSDIAGEGSYAIISEGQFPEDPQFIGAPQGTFGLLSNTSFSVPILPKSFGEPSDGGQYGLSLRGYLDKVLNGVEFGVYFLNYHSRLPYGSVISTDESCWRDSTTFAQAFVDCRGFNGAQATVSAPGTNTPVSLPPLNVSPVPPEVSGPVADAAVKCREPRHPNDTVNPTREGCEPVPVDTLGVFLEYPENIRMFGVSFNTTVGKWSLAGEYSYRPNLPVQVQLQDVVFAGVTPMFPRVPLEIPGVATIPTARQTTPDYIETIYRGNPNIQGNTIIHGYERLKVGQLSLTGIRVLSGTENPVFADQVLLLVEAGFTQVFDLPGLDRIQFDGGSANATHASPGADGTGSGGVTDSARTVPTQQTTGFAEDFAWGYRVLTRLEYNDVSEWTPVVRHLFGFFHDVDGVSVAPMQNFIEGRVQMVIGSQVEFNQKLSATALYQFFGGGGSLNKISDRDFAALSLAYNF